MANRDLKAAGAAPILDAAVRATDDYVRRMPKDVRKRRGQFFTNRETAAFMAGLLDIPPGRPVISALDPGAGSGALSAALVERLQRIDSVRGIDLVCYENDPNVLGLLRANLEFARAHSSKEVRFRIVEENYIVSQRADYNRLPGPRPPPRKFDCVIGNPPYRKVSRDAPEARSMPDVCRGAPNLYFLFAAMSLFNLREGGEMVYIIPRSWTSGAYFGRFREKLLGEGRLLHVHLFGSRDKVFDGEDVLQETMIVKVRKAGDPPPSVTVTTTESGSGFPGAAGFEAPYREVVGGEGEGRYVYLVTNEGDVETVRRLKRWGDTLPGLGMKMRTGLTIDFRNRGALRDAPGEGAVPLFYPRHIRNGKVEFPAGREHEYIAAGRRGLLQKNENYLFVKRFTAKEERRRLQCGIYLARRHPGYGEISTQNKINFIAGPAGLSECAVHGLYVLFNSTLYDGYYRILNGSTQVNSTEVNSMPVPPMPVIEAMGRELIRAHDLSEASCDAILEEYL